MSLIQSSDDISIDVQEQFEKKVSFIDEVASLSDTESTSEESSSSSAQETFLPSVSSLSDNSETFDSVHGIKKSSSSISFNNSDTRDVKNVLKKRYSKLAFSVQGVREGNVKRSTSSRRLKR